MSGFELDLSGRVVIVSGAGGGGIGTAVTRMAARAGAIVIAADCASERLDPHIAPLIKEGLSIHPVVSDVIAEEGVARVMAEVDRTGGELHGLVTVVGGGPPATWGPTTKLSREHWHAQLALNVDSMLFMSQAVAARLMAEGRPGSIVAVSSVLGLTASPYNAGYGAGKAAVVSVVQTMAVEFATRGIRVNAVAPGPIVTPTANLSMEPARLKRGIPMGRHGTTAEIAGPVLFLLSDLSGYMTGQCLIADGGCSVKWSHLTDDNLPMFLKDDSVAAAMAG